MPAAELHVSRASIIVCSPSACVSRARIVIRSLSACISRARIVIRSLSACAALFCWEIAGHETHGSCWLPLWKAIRA